MKPKRTLTIKSDPYANAMVDAIREILGMEPLYGDQDDPRGGRIDPRYFRTYPEKITTGMTPRR